MRQTTHGDKIKAKDLIKKAEIAGWELARIQGSHYIFRHPNKPHTLSIPVHNKDLGKGIAHKLLKQAGLK